MADISLFGNHFGSFARVVEDYALLGSDRVVGRNNGLKNVKGYTDDMEVLTSRGWLLFEQVGDILLEEQRQWEDWVALQSSVKSLGVDFGGDPAYVRTRYSYDPLLVASVSPYQYDEGVNVGGNVGKGGTGLRRPGRPAGVTAESELLKSAGTGRVVFVQPTGFYQWNYDRPTLRLKMRGVDVTGTMWADYPVKRKYKPGYQFMRATKMYEVKYPEYFYLVLNKFSMDVGKDFVPARSVITSDEVREWWWGKQLESQWWEYRDGVRTPPSRVASQGRAWFLGEVAKTFQPRTVLPSTVLLQGKGAMLFPAASIHINNNYSGNVYNVTAPPHKTLIVRKERPRSKRNPQVTVGKHWEGNPTVVGDMSNKYVPPHGGYRKPQHKDLW